MLYLGLFMLLGGLLVLSFTGSIIRMGIGGLSVLLGIAFIGYGMRPAGFKISADGLTLRMPGIKRPVGWSEIHALILEQPLRLPGTEHTPDPRLLLVPVAGSPLNDKLDQRSPLDQQPCREVLDVGDFKESADDIARALAQFGGERFIDARSLPPYNGPDFPSVSGGHAPLEVQSLIRQAMMALASGSPQARWAAQQAIERRTFTKAIRGYDPAQVDAYFHHLSTSLAGSSR